MLRLFGTLFGVLQDLMDGVRDRLQIPLPLSSQFKRINELLFPLKSSEYHRLSEDFRGNRSE